MAFGCLRNVFLKATTTTKKKAIGPWSTTLQSAQEECSNPQDGIRNLKFEFTRITLTRSAQLNFCNLSREGIEQFNAFFRLFNVEKILGHFGALDRIFERRNFHRLILVSSINKF